MRGTMMARLRKLKMTYAEYLTSDHWQDVRRRYRESDLPQACLGCDSTPVDLHHRTYTRLGRELLTDIVPLCRKCHVMVHEYEKVSALGPKDTHKILRLAFGWTKKQTRAKFAPYQIEGRSMPYAMNPRIVRPEDLVLMPCSKTG